MAQLVKNPPAMRETWVRSLGWEDPLEKGTSPGGNGYPLQYSGLENSMVCRVHGVAKSRARLSDFHSLTKIIKPVSTYFVTIMMPRPDKASISGLLIMQVGMLSCFWPYGLRPVRLLCLRDSPGMNTGVGCHALRQRIFPTQRSNLCLLCPPASAGGFVTTNIASC